MDSKNNDIEHELLDESDFTSVSSIGIDMKQMAEKIQKLEETIKKKNEIQMDLQINKKFSKMENKMNEMMKENERLKQEIEKMVEENVEKCHQFEEMKKEIQGFKEENGKLKGKICVLEKQIDELSILTEQIDRKEWVKFYWNEYKLNAADAGPKLTISDGGRIVNYSGQNCGDNCVRAILPIPKFNLKDINKLTITFYFEVEILNKIAINGIGVGFCDKEFLLQDKWLGNERNSIGICNKGGVRIDGSVTEFGNEGGYFNREDVIGLGIIYLPNSKMHCFTTLNGKLLGKAELVAKFGNVKLFPAVTLYFEGESIRLNFGKDKWQFKRFEQLVDKD